MKEYSSMPIDMYVEELSSKNAVPGGGGTSALVGALGTALTDMVGNLTVGKKKYAAVEDEIQKIMAETDKIKAELLSLIDKDPVVFEPLSKAYGLPSGTPEEAALKAEVLEKCLHEAASVPIAVMDCCAEGIELTARIAEIGSPLVVSDAGCAVLLLKAAMEGAALNVLVNTKFMKDREYAAQLNSDAARFIAEFGDKADAVYDKIYGRLLRSSVQ